MPADNLRRQPVELRHELVDSDDQLVFGAARAIAVPDESADQRLDDAWVGNVVALVDKDRCSAEDERRSGGCHPPIVRLAG